MTFEEWNDVLARRFFNPGQAGKRVYLHTTKELLVELSSSNTGVDDFIAVIKLGPAQIRNGEMCSRAIAVAKNWRASGVQYPPYIAYLCLFALAASHDGDWPRHAYYPRLSDSFYSNPLLRRKLQMKIPIISFFTGGGFLDLGFEEAGFDVKWTNEFNSYFGSIYAHAMTAWRKSKNKTGQEAKISSQESIEELTPEKVMSEAFGKNKPELFGVIGGPPCTDFSVGGLHAGHKGSAGKLTSVYVKMLLGLKPGFFLLENVPHLETNPKHRKQFLKLLSNLEIGGYAVKVAKLNSLEYGVPQDRLRLFVIGFQRDLMRKWYPGEYFPKRVLAREFKWPVTTHPNAKAAFEWPKTSKFGSTPDCPKTVPMELCTHRAVSQLPDPETLPNGKDFFTPHSAKFGEIAEGDVSGKSFKRLHRFRYSPTSWYGNNEVHLHPWKKRRLSVREALRLQTVPDTYVMPEDVPLCAKFKVIGNGVPCQLAQRIAEYLHQFIEANQRKHASVNGHAKKTHVEEMVMS